MNNSSSKNPLVAWEKLMAEVERPALYYRRPGRYRRWEIGDIIDRHGDFRVMEDGMTSDHTRLYAVYRRDPKLRDDVRAALRHEGVPGTIPDELAPTASPAPSVDSLDSLAARACIFAVASADGAAQQTLMLADPLADRRLARMPGLFVRWELKQVLDSGDYHIEPAGTLMDGTDLFAVFQRKRAAHLEDG
jgi:hypothetical protein